MKIFLLALFACCVFCAASSTEARNIADTLWVLDPNSGAPSLPNTDGVPLFGNVSFSFRTPAPSSNGMTQVHFCFATGYSWQFPINATPIQQQQQGGGGGGGVSQSTTFLEPTHLFFQNMFMGLEYQKGNVSQVTFVQNSNSVLEIVARRPMSSSQKQGMAREILRFATSSANSSMLLTWKRIFDWDPKKVIHTTTWNFIPSAVSLFSPNPLGCTFSSSKFDKKHPSRNSILQQHEMNRRQENQKASVENFVKKEDSTKNNNKMSAYQQQSFDTYLKRKQEAASFPLSPSEQLKRLPKEQQANVSYVLFINNTWNISNGDLNENGFLLGLQGLVNRDKPTLYFVYPPTWTWTDSLAIFDFYNETGGDVGLTFVTLRTLHDVLDVFYAAASSGVWWTKQAREALIAGWSLAGVHSSFLIEVNDFQLQIDINTRRRDNNLPHLEMVDIAGSPFFNSMTMNKTAASSWLYDKVWQNVSKKFIVSVGGTEGEIIHPGVADWIVSQKTFAHDLTANAEHTPDQYNFYKKMLSEMAAVNERECSDTFCGSVGWHPYSAYSAEHLMTTLVSSQKMAVEGLNTQPNFSFNYRVRLPAGWQYRPNKMPIPSPSSSSSFSSKKRLSPQHEENSNNENIVNFTSAVFMSLVQTDGIGLGAWTKPGRGLIPYSWEVTLPDLYLQPAVVRYLFLNATKNDYFVGALGGLGYMYPKAVPQDYLPVALNKAQNTMTTLGLETMIIFDASECQQEYTTTGDTNLNQTLVDDYCKYMNNVQGFMNGYTNANSWSVCPKVQHENAKSSHPLQQVSHEKKIRKSSRLPTLRRTGPGAFISFDYYVDMSRSQSSIVQDLQQLFSANPVRPYFISLHVREWNDEQRMAEVIAATKKAMAKINQGELHIVTADVLVELAGKYPTFRQHFS